MPDAPPERRERYAHFRRIPTRWLDVDVYGHVNNVVYYAYFDTVINGYLVDVGVLDPHGGDVVGFARETMCRFHRPIAFPQAIDAGLRVGHVGRTSVRYEIGLFIEGEDEPARRRPLRARLRRPRRAPARAAARRPARRPPGPRRGGVGMTAPLEPLALAREAILQPIGGTGLVEQTVRRLGEAIGLGILEVGERLPAEPELSERLGISPMTLREALVHPARGRATSRRGGAAPAGRSCAAPCRRPRAPPRAGGWRA